MAGLVFFKAMTVFMNILCDVMYSAPFYVWYFGITLKLERDIGIKKGKEN